MLSQKPNGLLFGIELPSFAEAPDHQIMHVQEEERLRISRELHDEIAQTLVKQSVQLTMCRQGSQIKD